MAVTIFTATGIAVFLAKGYIFSTQENRIIGTGIISVTSEPDSASVFIDDHLTTATNATISSLPPKKYTIKVVKEGFIPWERQVDVKEGLVTELKIILFPSLPTIYPLTFSGVKNAVLSDDGSKLAYIVPSGPPAGWASKKAGVWVWTMVKNQPIAFVRSSEPHQIAQNNNFINFSESKLQFSPDSKFLMVTLDGNSYQLDADSFNSEPKDITLTFESLLKSWSDEKGEKEQLRLATIKDLNMQKIASASATLKWAPDESKFIFGESAVYELETNRSYPLPKAKSYVWLPDSRHIILVEEGIVSVVDFDGTNQAVIFAGKFEDNFVFPWPDSSRLVIISSFPTPTASLPNLYGVNLK